MLDPVTPEKVTPPAPRSDLRRTRRLRIGGLMPPTEEKTPTRLRLLVKKYPTVAMLSTVATVAVVVLVVLWIRGEEDGLALEAAKGSIQVLTVAVIGSAATIAVKSSEERRAERLKASEERRAQRRQEEEFLTAMMCKTMESYNLVKRSRRQLDAECRRADGQ